MTANELASSGISTQDFIPASKSDWRSDSLTGTALQPWANRTNVRLKFDFISGGGNHFYLDDINISGPLSIENQLNGFESLQVFPNPAKQSFSVHLNLAEAGLGLFQLTDLSGRTVHEWSLQLGMGEQAQFLNVPNHIQSGTYLLSFKLNNTIQIQRLILQ